MSQSAFRLRPANPAPSPCKLCGGVSRLFGVTDFNRGCSETRGSFLPVLGIPIYYRQCDACGLLFTEAFDDWSAADFEAHIYNEAYGAVDPDYETARPQNNARLVVNTFGASAGELSALDYGGGNGVLARALGAAGFARADTYDPFHPAHRTRPERRYDLVTCFETLEHMPDPVAGAADIVSFLEDDGLLVISTLTQPADFPTLRMQWWYAGPRNGHVTLHTRASLGILWARHGLRVHSFNDNVHAVFRRPPAFARHILKDAAP